MTPAELKQARHTLNLTGAQLGVLLGVSERMIRHLESGSRVIRPGQANHMKALLTIHECAVCQPALADRFSV
jgi:DNA-binding transcriptional regulator YiaG